jgi:hypothetical protein
MGDGVHLFEYYEGWLRVERVERIERATEWWYFF